MSDPQALPLAVLFGDTAAIGRFAAAAAKAGHAPTWYRAPSLSAHGLAGCLESIGTRMAMPIPARRAASGARTTDAPNAVYTPSGFGAGAFESSGDGGGGEFWDGGGFDDERGFGDGGGFGGGGGYGGDGGGGDGGGGGGGD